MVPLINDGGLGETSSKYKMPPNSTLFEKMLLVLLKSGTFVLSALSAMLCVGRMILVKAKTLFAEIVFTLMLLNVCVAVHDLTTSTIATFPGNEEEESEPDGRVIEPLTIRLLNAPLLKNNCPATPLPVHESLVK